MANWNKPDLSSLKSGFPGECRALAESAIKLNPSADSNIPTDALYYNQTSKRLQKWNGSAWVDVAIGTSLLATFSSDVLADSVTDQYLFGGGFIGDNASLVGIKTNIILPFRSYITRVVVYWGDSGFTSGTRTVKLTHNGTTFHTVNLATTDIGKDEEVTPINTTGDIRVRVTQGSGSAAAAFIRVSLFGSTVQG